MEEDAEEASKQKKEFGKHGNKEVSDSLIQFVVLIKIGYIKSSSEVS